jgi:hypothetical protein
MQFAASAYFEEKAMSRETRSNAEKYFIVFFRLTMGWTFLYAAIHHFGDDKFVVASSVT